MQTQLVVDTDPNFYAAPRHMLAAYLLKFEWFVRSDHPFFSPNLFLFLFLETFIFVHKLSLELKVVLSGLISNFQL